MNENEKKEAEGDPVRILSFAVEGVKKVAVVEHLCGSESLTVIGGENRSGKTSVLDGIAWTLGGDRFKPSDPIREGAKAIATKIELSNGITVERRGAEGGVLKITAPAGKKGGQALLNEFISAFALDLPRFMAATAKEKADLVLEKYPEASDRLRALGDKIDRAYRERHGLGVIATRKRKHAEDLPFDSEAGSELRSVADLAAKIAEGVANNSRRAEAESEAKRIGEDLASELGRLEEFEKRVASERADRGSKIEALREKAKATSLSLEASREIPLGELQGELAGVEEINARVRRNLDKERAEMEAEEIEDQISSLSADIELNRSARRAILAEIPLELEGLSFSEEGELELGGKRWDCMSGAEQIRVAVAIARKIRPDCGFVLVDGLEAMDLTELRSFGRWLARSGLQAIGTRVSTGDECSLILYDGERAKAGDLQF